MYVIRMMYAYSYTHVSIYFFCLLQNKVTSYLLIATFSRGSRCSSVGVRIVRTLWTVLDRVCIITACAANWARVSPAEQKVLFYIFKIINSKQLKI